MSRSSADGAPEPPRRGLRAALWRNRIWWLPPLVLVFVILGLLVVIGQDVPPFLYTLF
jgi:hypothetical protein